MSVFKKFLQKIVKGIGDVGISGDSEGTIVDDIEEKRQPININISFKQQAIYNDMYVSSDDDEEWWEKDIQEWERIDLQHFFDYVGLEEINHLFKNYNGKRFIDMDNKILLIRKVRNDALLFKIEVYHDYLHRLVYELMTPYFNRNFVVVFNKMKRTEGLLHFSPLEISKYCNFLIDEKMFKQLYLENNSESNEHLRKIIRANSPCDETRTSFSKFGSSTDKIDKMEIRKIHKMNNVVPTTKQWRQQLKVKLIITETIFNTRSLLLRKIISPVLNIIPTFRPRFGLFHTALMVGPWYLHWTDSELCIPKKAASNSAIASIDLEPLMVYTLNDIEEVKNKIAKIAVKWNTTYKYRRIPAKEKRAGNCQTFILEMFEELGIKCDFNGPIKEFINRIGRSGVGDMIFSPSEEFILKFKLNSYQEYRKWKISDTCYHIAFETHEELDNFCYECIKKSKGIMGLMDDFRDEYLLLKSFDRAFWMRYLKDSANQKNKPSSINKRRSFGNILPTGCPFSDPRSTKSFV